VVVDGHTMLKSKLMLLSCEHHLLHTFHKFGQFKWSFILFQHFGARFTFSDGMDVYKYVHISNLVTQRSKIFTVMSVGIAMSQGLKEWGKARNTHCITICITLVSSQHLLTSHWLTPLVQSFLKLLEDHVRLSCICTDGYKDNLSQFLW